jgi:dTDP-4-amino-4,6-dideoxygalactose transaminase
MLDLPSPPLAQLAINDLSRHNGQLRAELAAALTGVLDSGWYVLGRQVALFEEAFAEYCGTAYAVGVANGTDALELALAAVGVERGDRVALAANAGGYASTAARALGARPSYVDVDPDSHCLDPQALDAALRAEPARAVVVTHLYGRVADMTALGRITRAHGVKLVEDGAQAHGASRGGKRAGAWGDAAAFSFYPTKNLGALGDAGAVVTSDGSTAQRLTRLRQYGWESKYRQVLAGARNSRLDELQAAVLLTKLPRLDEWNAGRRAVASRYAATIEHPKLALPSITGPDHVAHLYVVRTEERDALARYLRAHGVPYDIHYPVPDHRQPSVAAEFADVSLPVTERLCMEVLTLPCFPELTAGEVDRIAGVVNRWES